MSSRANDSSPPRLTTTRAGGLYCNNCENQLYEDAKDDDGNPLRIVYDGRHAYGDMDCKDSRDKLIADANAKGKAFKVRVVAERPDLIFGEFKIGYPWIVMSTTFKFPGCQYGGSVCDQEDSRDLTWYVAQGDKAAWDFYQ